MVLINDPWRPSTRSQSLPAEPWKIFQLSFCAKCSVSLKSIFCGYSSYSYLRYYRELHHGKLPGSSRHVGYFMVLSHYLLDMMPYPLVLSGLFGSATSGLSLCLISYYVLKVSGHFHDSFCYFCMANTCSPGLCEVVLLGPFRTISWNDSWSWKMALNGLNDNLCGVEMTLRGISYFIWGTSWYILIVQPA